MRTSWMTLVVAFILGGSSLARAEVDATGSFNHSVAIALPAATGAQPQLSLSYNSHAGNGPVGVGWDLEGFPVITRMNYGVGIDYHGTDTFVGPRGRLVNFNSTNVYRTEDETWGKYVPLNADGSLWTGAGGCGNGPCMWRLTESGGDLLEFGATNDSRIEAVGRAGAVRVWALSRYTDPAGNFYTIGYSEDASNGDYYPIGVTYNQGNGRSKFYTVELSYETRNDRAREYTQNAPVEEDARLKWISVTSGAQLIRKYRLDYEYGAATGQSRLSAVQEYGRDGTSTLPPQTFSYQEGGTEYGTAFGGATNQGSGALAWLTGDVNGDGKTDILQPWSNNGQLGLLVFTSTGSGFAQPWGSSNMGQGSSALAWLTGDVNGDGKTDVIQPWSNNGRLGLIVYTSTGSSYVQSWGSSDMQQGSPALAWLTGDVNGDGKTDIIQPWSNNGRLGLIVYTSTGSSYVQSWGSSDMNQGAPALAWLTGDVNGDGKTDIIQVWDNNGRVGLIVYTSTGSGYVQTWGSSDMQQGSPALAWLAEDVNGDGKTDIIQPWSNNGRLGLIVYTSTGSGYVNSWGSSNMEQGSPALAWLTGDANGDGKTDIIQPWSNNGRLGLIVYTSTGSSYVQSWGSSDMQQGSPALAWLTGDVNGDGKTDVIQSWDNGGRGSLIAYDARFPTADLLIGVNNGVQGTTSITYAPAAQVPNAIRPDLTTCAICGNANPASVPLVTRVAASDGRGNTYSTRYEYFNSRYFPGVPSEAEHLGFEWTKVIDEQLGNWEVTYHRQDKPFHGRVGRTEAYAATGQLLSRTLTNYQRGVIAIPPHATRMILTTDEEQQAYELGVLEYRTKTVYGHDSYGNVTLVSDLNDVSTAADDVYTSTSYINDMTQWRLGVPHTVRTCADADCSSVLQQTVNYYDGLSLGQVGPRTKLTRTSQWRSDTGTYLHTRYTYDAAGKALTHTNPAGIVAGRNEYDAVSGALIRATDALGYTVTYEYDGVTGQLTAATDINGNTSNFYYDLYGRKNRTETPHNGAIESIVDELLTFDPYQKSATIHTDSGTLTTTDHLDGLGRVWKTTQTWDNGALLQTDSFFDAAGRDYRTCAPHVAGDQRLVDASCTTKYFDAEGRVVRLDAPRSGGGFNTATTAYDGYRITSTDPAGNVTVADYDPASLTSTLTQPGGLATATSKDLLGRVIRVADPAGNAATYSYNSLGWKLSQNDPVVGTLTYQYDPLGNLVSQTDAAGTGVNMYYDSAGRLIRSDYAPLNASTAGSEDSLLKYDYLSAPGDIANGKGQLVRVQDRAGTTTFAYDVAGRVRTATKAVDGAVHVVTTAYDRTGKRTAVTYPDGSVVGYRYETDAGHLSAITLDGVEVMRYGSYNERGAPTSFTYGTGVNDVSLTFELSTGELLQQQDARGFLSNLYAYDARGMLIQERDLRASKPNGDTSKAFAYDPLGQLVAAAMGANAACNTAGCSGSAWSRSYRYDNTGRVLEKDGKAFTYDVSKRFQLTRVAGETADRTYDPVGRLLSKTGAAGTDTYLNGTDGFLHQHRRGGATLHRMTYDYQGNRVKKEFLGTNPQTTWDLGSYKIVHDLTTGKYFHTLYVMGLHGSRIAHRTVEKPGMVAAAAWGAYQDRALASLYEPMSAGGLLPWATHQSKGMFRALLTDLDGARGVVAALVALAMLTCTGVFAVLSIGQLLSAALAKLRPAARPRRRAAWLAPAMLCAATAACVGNYDTEPVEQATAESIGKDGRYSVMQAISRSGTNQPVPGTFYYLNSPLGSTSVMFDAQGAALLRLEYFPDGTVNTAASQGDYIATHTFGQKEYDKELEAYYNAFRYYDAETMRFTTPDAVKDSSDFLVHNAYAYTRNNPINYTDPTGFWAMKADGAGGRKNRPIRPRIEKRPTPKRYVPPAKARLPNPQRTSRFNRGPDGGPKIPVKREITIPGRDYNPQDGIRGYEASKGSRLDSIQFERVMTNGMPSMRTPDKVHDVLGLASYLPVVGRAAAGLDAGLYLLVDGDALRAGAAVLGAGRAGAATNADEAADLAKITKRPKSFRTGTRQSAWRDAADGAAPGSKVCPTCDKEVYVAPGKGPRDWDIDHQPPWSTRDLTGMSRKEVLDEYNRGVRLECPTCNRSRGARAIE